MYICQNNSITINHPFGIENNGKLRSVLVHTPVLPISKQNKTTDQDSLYLIQEHNKLCSLLTQAGIEVIQLRNLINENCDIIDVLPELPNLGFTAVISNKGAFLSRLFLPSRCFEELLIKEALQQLSIPIIHEFYANDDSFEGFIILDNKTLFVTVTENHQSDSVIKFIQNALIFFEEIIKIDIPKTKRFICADSVFNKLRSNCIMIYQPAILQTTLFRRYNSTQIDLIDYFKRREIDCIFISDSEQQHHACSFISIDSETILQFDSVFEENTIISLQKKNIKIITFTSEFLSKKNGALSSYALQVLRM